jgi:hypothetical protein
MKLIQKLVEAWKETKKDLAYMSEELREIEKNSFSYYEKKEIKNQEFLILFGVPIQYFSRLCGKNYWNVNTS